MRDEWFIRGKVPMTKSEVRAVSLSKLELGENFVLYDVGAGTGSVSVEAALSSGSGRVYAIEEKEEALQLIRENREKFAAENIIIVEGHAPEVLVDLAMPTHAFIGGTKGSLEEILQRLEEKNPGIRVVINAVTLETLQQAVSYCKTRKKEAEVVQIMVSKAEKLGAYYLMQGQNPVYIISYGGKESCQ